jgi:hypothetical protein
VIGRADELGQHSAARSAIETCNTIDWELTYTITRLEDDTDATSECQPTIANDDE